MLHQINPIIVQVIEAPTRETTVVDVLLGALGLIGVLLVSCAVLGVLLGGVLVAVRKRRARRGLDLEVTQPRLGLGPQTLTFEPGDSSASGYRRG